MGGDLHSYSGELTSLSAVDAVRRGTDPKCHSKTCREGGCTITLYGAPEPFTLLSLEHVAAPVDLNAPRSDYLFVGGNRGNGEWVAPIELTASSARVSKFLPQFRAGAEIASRLIPRNLPVRFRPVAAYGGELRRIEVRNFLKRSNQVVFRNVPTPIKLVRCGSPLNKALKG